MFNLDVIAATVCFIAAAVSARGTATLNLQLKFAILEAGFLSQQHFAFHVHIAPSRMSAIVRGWVELRDEERAAMAAALGKSEKHLFRHQTAEPPL